MGNNSESSIYKIDTSSFFDNFYNELSSKGNDRIFFSGQFGSGKTTFLKDFFEFKNDEYDVYHLFPIHYQIKADDDVWEFIKYDLLIQLINKYPKILSEDKIKGIKQNVFLFHEFVTSNYTFKDFLFGAVNYTTEITEVADSIFKTKFHKLGKPIKDLLVLDREYQDFKKNYKTKDQAIIENFISTMESKENDVISHLLSLNIKSGKSDKKSVLIIDDIDRMDPSNLFRMLNIISSFYEKEDENKFGFDKIILVGDINSTRSVFEHFYGKKTDFWGYIDKFYSKNIYKFRAEEIIGSEIKKIVQIIGTDGDVIMEGFQNENYFLSMFLNEVLIESLSVTNGYNLRQLIKAIKHSKSIIEECEYPKKDVFDNRNTSIWKTTAFSIRLLMYIFKTEEQFMNVLSELKSKKPRRKVESNFYLLFCKVLIQKIVKVEDTTPESNISNFGDFEFDFILGDDLIKFTPNSLKKDPREFFYSVLIEIIDKKLYENN